MAKRKAKAPAAENSRPSAKRKRRPGGPGRPFVKGQPMPAGAKPFPPGVSGNPGGRPKDLDGWRADCRERSHAIAKVLEEIALGLTEAERDQVAAGKTIIEHGWGRPTQPMEHSGPGGVPLGIGAATEDPLIGLTDEEVDRYDAAQKEMRRLAEKAKANAEAKAAEQRSNAAPNKEQT